VRLIVFFFTIIVLISNTTFSQERKITGHILDLQTQKPVRNASIIILGTTSGTFSNHLGFFELTVDRSKNKTLVVSHIGFKTSKVLIPEEDKFKFLLEKEFTLLNMVNLSLYPKNVINDQQAENEINSGESAVDESEAMFPGGTNNFYNLIGNLLVKEIVKMPDSGFTISFTINETGQATNISISDTTQLSEVIVVQAFQSMPSWKPATQRQNNVAQHFLLPIVPIVNFNIVDVKTIDFKNYYDFISKNIKYPAQARRMAVEGVVYVEFELDETGQILSVKTLRDIGGECGDEVKRVITTMPSALSKLLFEQTRFSKFVLPVHFGLEEPFRSNEEYISHPDALQLGAVMVTAIGTVRERQGAGYPTNIPSNTSISMDIGSSGNYSYHNLTAALEKPKTVKRLSPINNGIVSFPVEILKLTNLEFLDLERNFLKALPNEIENLTDLRELYGGLA